MAVIERNVRLPDGRIVPVQVPSDASTEEIQDFVMGEWDAGTYDTGKVKRNAMTSSPKAGTPQGDFPWSFSNAVGAIGEPVITALSSLRGQSKAGYEAMVGAYQGDPNLRQQVDQTVREATYEPRTSGGKMSSQFLAEQANKYLGPEGLDVLGKGEEMSQQAFERTGSPTIAAAYETLPTYLESVSGVKAITSLQGMVRLKNADGTATTALQQLLAAQGLSYDALSAEARASIPMQVNRSTLSQKPSLSGREIAGRDIRAGGTQEGLARFEETPFNPFRDVKIDPVAMKAIDLDVDEGVIQMIKESDPSTRMRMLQILNQHQTKSYNRGSDADPYAVVGQALESRVKFLDRQADNAALRLNSIVRGRFEGAPVDTSALQQAALKGLEELKIGYGRNEYGSPLITTGKNGELELKLDFNNSVIAKDPASQKMVSDTLDLILNRATPDAASLHLLKQQLDGLIDWNKADKGGVIPPKGRNFVKGLRWTSNDILRGIDTEYAKVNDVLSTVLDAKGDLYDSLVTSARELAQEGEWAAAGNDLRKLFTNYGKGYEQVAALKNIDNAIIKLSNQPTGTGIVSRTYTPTAGAQAGYTVDQASLFNLGELVIELDRLVKPSKSGNLQSRIAAGNMDQTRAIRELSQQQGVLNRALNLATKPFEVDPKLADRTRKLDTYAIIQELVKASKKR